MNKITSLALSIHLLISPVIFAEDFVPQETSGLETMSELVERPFVQQEIVEENYVSAEDQIYAELARKGWIEGWDEKNKRLFVVQSEMFDSEDPNYDDNFITKRSQFAMLATLSAKAKMVEFMHTQMSAFDQISAPGTDVHAELNEQYTKLERKIEAQQKALEKMLIEVNAAEADKLKGVTWNDRSYAYMNALIKKIDASYSVSNIDEKKIAKFAKAKKGYEEANAQLLQIQEQAQAIKDEIKLESFSAVETLAKAPILGASVLLQSESWNAEDKRYEVATLMVWSPKLERAAKAIITGEAFTLKPKNGMSVQGWLQSQEAATLIGPRQYIDKNGSRWFIGTYAMPVEGSSSMIKKNKSIAEMMAKKETSMALYADIETHKQASIAMQTHSGDLNGKDQTKIATSVAETTRQSIENRNVKGLSKLLSKTITHPISKQKIYVVAYGLSSSSAADALKMEVSSINAATKAITTNKVNGANKQALDRKLEAAKLAPVVAASINQNEPSFDVDIKKVPKTASSKNTNQTLLNAPSFDEDDF